MSEKKLIGCKCNNCGKKIYPKRIICPECKQKSFSDFEIDKIGTIITYTKLYAVPDGLDVKPLLLGVADFNGINIMGQITNKEIKIGDKIRPFWGKLRKSQTDEIFGFKFELIKNP